MTGLLSDLWAATQFLSSALLTVVGGALCASALFAWVALAISEPDSFMLGGCCMAWMGMPAAILLALGLSGLREVRLDSYQSTAGGVVERTPEPGG